MTKEYPKACPKRYANGFVRMRDKAWGDLGTMDEPGRSDGLILLEQYDVCMKCEV